MTRDPILLFASGLIAGSLITGTIVLSVARRETREAQALAKAALDENRRLQFDGVSLRQAARLSALSDELERTQAGRAAPTAGGLPGAVAIDATLQDVRVEQARLREEQARKQAAQAVAAARWAENIATLEAAIAQLPADDPRRADLGREIAGMRAKLDGLRAPVPQP